MPPTQGKGKQKMMKKEEFARLCAEHAVKNGKTWVETKEFLDRVDIRSESQKASQLSEAILVEADTVAAADAEENTDPTMSVPQRVKDYGDDIADLSFVRVSDFEKTWHVAKLDDVPYTAAQVLPTCKLCGWSWKHDIQRSDLDTHFISGRHLANKDKTSATVSKDCVIMESFGRGKGFQNALFAEAAAMAGISFRSGDIFLSHLSGKRIPNDIKLTNCWNSSKKELIRSHLDHISKNVQGKPLSVIHDNGTLNGGHCVLVIVQTSTRSYALAPEWAEDGNPFDKNTLSEAVLRALDTINVQQSQVRMMRSDRGGANVALSRELALQWDIPFLSCIAHFLNNVLTDVRNHLKSENSVAFDIVYWANYIIKGTKQSRWKKVQRDTAEKSAMADVAAIVMQIRQDSLMSTTREQIQSFSSAKEMCLDAVKAEAHRTTIIECKDLEELCVCVERIVKSESSAASSAPAVSAPHLCDTRFISMIAAMRHFQSRLKAYYVFIAKEVTCSTVCDSVLRTAELFVSVPFHVLQAEVDMVCDVLGELEAMVKKYANLQCPGLWQAGDVLRDIENLTSHYQEKCDTLEQGTRAHAIVTVVCEGLKRWETEPEIGRDYYTACRQMTPAGYRIHKRGNKLIKPDDIISLLNLSGVTVPMIEEYEELAAKTTQTTSAFWKRYPKSAVLQEAVTDALSIAPTCTAPDSVLSALAHIFPPSRKGLTRDNQKWLSLIFLNKDVSKEQQNGKTPHHGVRSGFPRVQPTVQAEEEVEVEDLTADACNMSIEECMEHMSRSLEQIWD